jgi:hypothetical protein
VRHLQLDNRSTIRDTDITGEAGSGALNLGGDDPAWRHRACDASRAGGSAIVRCRGIPLAERPGAIAILVFFLINLIFMRRR